MKTEQKNIIYKPILFCIGTFAITWCCIWLLGKTDYNKYGVFYTFLDFLENVSPLFCALLLFRHYLKEEKFLWCFFFGKTSGIYSYIIVFLLFLVQFLNFYFFKIESDACSVRIFIITFAGQLLLGGGLEEAGWRGYLLPCLYNKHPILVSSVLVSIIWVFWHLPYFFISGSMQAEQSFFAYFMIGIITGFILSAIYLLTESVLLCMLFHSWQNTIVMTIQADMENVGFLLMFIMIGIVSGLICVREQKR